MLDKAEISKLVSRLLEKLRTMTDDEHLCEECFTVLPKSQQCHCWNDE